MGIFSKKTLLESDIKYLKKAFIYQFIYDFLEKPYSVNEETLKIDRLTLVFDDIICWKKAEEYYIELRNCGTYSQDDAYLIISDKNKETVDIHSLMKGISKHNMHELEEAYNEHLKQLATSLYFHSATTGFYFKRKNVYSGHDMNEYLKNGGYIISDIVEASKNEDTLQIFYNKKLKSFQNDWQKQAFKVMINSVSTKSFDLLDTEIYKHITLDEFKNLKSSIFTGAEIKVQNFREERFIKR